jgi:hypothetical protein
MILPILTWLTEQVLVNRPVVTVWADLRNLRAPPRKLDERIRWALELYPCDLLLVHRDAEGQAIHQRCQEIQEAVQRLSGQAPPVVCVVPVRMSEAWLLLEAEAIRLAAGNPGGNTALGLPDPARVEHLPDPKETLHEALRRASGLAQRRRRGLHIATLALRVANHMTDFERLRQLPAFRATEQSLTTASGSLAN